MLPRVIVPAPPWITMPKLKAAGAGLCGTLLDDCDEHATATAHMTGNTVIRCIIISSIEFGDTRAAVASEYGCRATSREPGCARQRQRARVLQ
jgi:hypothetical protein